MQNSQNLLQLNGGRKAFGAQLLFEEATFSINEGEHVGVIGPNGAGKSTLFKILIGQEDLDEGQLIRSQNLRLGYLSQHDHWEPGQTGNDYLDKVCTIPTWQAKTLGKELKVSEEILNQPILSLSGGYRMRIKLLGLLGKDPNLMMLDEPTNYLDLETTLLLERFLQSYEGAFLLISHDREVLRRTTDHTLEVEGGEVIKYSGNIDDYFEQKELLRTQLEAQAQNQALKRKAIMDFVNRFGAKATKAAQAQSKLKSLEKMEVIELKPVPVRSAIKIPPPIHVGKTVLKLEQCQFGYAQRTVLRNVHLEIRRGDHVSVVGLNGAGKSTLLKGLAGALTPQLGQRTLGMNVDVAIFNQHVVEHLDPQHTVYESLEQVAAAETTSQDIRNMAGSLLFSADSIEKRIEVLSGGEKSRVALGRILLKKAPFLLLDEPTNHLDFQTVEALTQALTSYEGTLIVVSHDRNFIRRVGTKILEVSNGQVRLYPGTYDEYVWSLQRSLAEHVDDGPAQLKISKQASSAVTSKPLQRATSQKDLSKRIRILERDLEATESELAESEMKTQEINQAVAGGVLSKQELGEKMQALAQLTLRTEELEADWLAKTQELEELRQMADQHKR